MPTTPEQESATVCHYCGAALAPAALSCPACNVFVHADELERLLAQAKSAKATGDLATALACWNRVSGLLPPETVQHRSVQARIAELNSLIAQRAAEPQKKRVVPKWVARFGPFGILLWKIKTILLVLATKGKLLLLGLTKLSTLATMAASLGLYWTLYGWQFGLGLVLLIYVHEMGHVAELRKFGIAASAPMFIPGFGAIVFLKQHPGSVARDARIGLAGPTWGLAGTLAVFALYLLTGAPIWAVLTRFGAWINLFNLIPVWQLDGSRGFASLTRTHRGLILALAIGTWFFTRDGVLLLIALASTYRLFTKDYAPTTDMPVLSRFAALLIVLALLCLVGIPAGAR